MDNKCALPALFSLRSPDQHLFSIVRDRLFPSTSFYLFIILNLVIIFLYQ